MKINIDVIPGGVNSPNLVEKRLAEMTRNGKRPFILSHWKGDTIVVSKQLNWFERLFFTVEWEAEK